MAYRTRTRSGTRVIGGLSPTIELFGDWEKSKALMDALPYLITLGSMRGQKRVAELLRRQIKKNIKAGGPPGVHWPPHSGYYSKNLYGVGVKNSFYYQTGRYYKSISIHKTKQSYHVGIKKGIQPSNPKANITLGEVAKVLEHGSSARNIQARPLWIPTWKQLKGNKRARGIITWNIANEIYKKFNVRPRIY